jgi:hypothetical protein
MLPGQTPNSAVRLMTSNRTCQLISIKRSPSSISISVEEIFKRYKETAV